MGDPALSDAARHILVTRLQSYVGKSIRLIRTGTSARTGVVFEWLGETLKQAGIKLAYVSVAAPVIVGTNFPDDSYITASSTDSDIVNALYSAFSEVGLKIGVAPRAHMFGDASPDAVVVIR